MESWMQRLFQMYAVPVTVQSGSEKKEAKAFFQSVNSRSWQNMEQIYGPLGQIPSGQYICILPAGSAQSRDILLLNEASYRICRLENMMLQDKVIYQWSLCTQKGGKDTWGSAS